jgi:hypothetical protein
MSTRHTIYASDLDKDELSIFWDYANLAYFVEVKSMKGRQENLTSEYVIVPLPERLRLALGLSPDGPGSITDKDARI